MIRNNLVATLPSWGGYYEVSFQMWVESFTSGLPRTRGWAELLRFTTSEAEAGKDMLPGTRIPAVFVNNEGYIGVRSQVGNDANFVKNINIDAKTWIEVKIKQYADDGKVILHFYKVNQAQNIEILKSYHQRCHFKMSWVLARVKVFSKLRLTSLLFHFTFFDSDRSPRSLSVCLSVRHKVL